MAKGEQIEIGMEEEEKPPPPPRRPEPANRFICHDCQDEGREPLVVSVEYYVRVEHLLEFNEDSGEYRLFKSIGHFRSDPTIYCVACDFDLDDLEPEEQDRIAKAAGVLCNQDRVRVECDHDSGTTDIFW